MAHIGYIRVSTTHQNTARQDSKLDSMGLDKIYKDKCSGKNTDRPQLQAMLDYIREGDVVVVDSYSRFSRNTRDLLNLVSKLNEKGVALVSLKENVDTSIPQGKLMMTLFAGLAEFEREQMLERQAEGIAEAKKAGKYTGRQPIQIPADMGVECKKWRAGEQTATETMKKLGLKPNTFYRKVKEMGF